MHTRRSILKSLAGLAVLPLHCLFRRGEPEAARPEALPVPDNPKRLSPAPDWTVTHKYSTGIAGCAPLSQWRGSLTVPLKDIIFKWEGCSHAG